ncbi:excinuclease ABC subunit UvrA [Corynebacterium halotolerans]|uniref:UvrABC system protein A n=2 Tax=Corynebacterium halotolerans TaxID=225326 RepID=M1NJB2_9CORY|nr:UvrABC system protein A [Corynebacterium halotolerans YIM 70093 = DSM 44683]
MIRVHGAHLHNLKHVDVELPRNRLVAFTGVSGSGKSSLAFGTLHGEAQRRYLESIAPFARRLIGSATDPQVESVEGLPPTVALEQNRSAGGARSSVGTVSTISNTVRLLYSRSGTYPPNFPDRLDSDAFSPNTTAGMCPDCHGTGVRHLPTEASMVPDPALTINGGAIAAWPGAWAGKNFHDILESLGYPMDTPWRDIPRRDRDWILFTEERPVVTIHPVRSAEQVQKTYEGTWRSVASYLRKTLAETQSDTLRRRTLSFMESTPCPTCGGRRLMPEALAVTYLGLPIDELNALPLARVHEMFTTRLHELGSGTDAEVLLLEQVAPILESTTELGLGHLSLGRGARTLSAGELQRLRLASQLRSGLFGVAYVLDEPSAGLHPEERRAVSGLMRRFLDAGNSVLLVEHDMSLVAGADWIVDVGPAAGEGGGEVLYSGPVDGLADEDSPTARALNVGPLTPTTRDDARVASGTLSLHGIHARTLDGLDLDLGLGQLTAVTGVSGSGKSTLISHVLAETLRERVTTTAGDAGDGSDDHDHTGGSWRVGEVTGAEQITRLVQITQKPIGRTPRSCLATYTGLFDKVRKLFAETDEARKRKWTVSRFSYNVKQGQCPTCNGEGQIEVELVFLPGSYTTCPDCHGARYNAETLEVTWHGLTVADVLGLTVDEAAEVFDDVSAIARAIRALRAVGLGYLRLGQGAPELSGGEAQRIKLATELQRTRRGHTVHLLDEPTTGLHPADVDKLLTELERLVDGGDTVVVVEHDLAMVARADRVIDLGPGAGADGGRIIADGTPAEVAETEGSATGRALKARAI